jgi:hypothetical protein
MLAPAANSREAHAAEGNLFFLKALPFGYQITTATNDAVARTSPAIAKHMNTLSVTRPMRAASPLGNIQTTWFGPHRPEPTH